jgi:hypothetical protein
MIVTPRGVLLAIVPWALPAFPADAPRDLDACNVVWTSPSADASGSMPIGNGEVGLNVWVEGGGDLLFYVARTDSWSETCRLLKLGRIRVALTPNPFAKGAPFRQELLLREGRIAIAAGEGEKAVALSVFVDIDRPVVRVVAESRAPFEFAASLETWRTQKKILAGKELESSWTMRKAPFEVWENPDVVRDDPANRVVWYHRNEHSVWAQTLKHQGLGSVTDRFHDPLIRRTSGGILKGEGLVKKGPAALASAKPGTRFDLAVATHAAQTDTADAWLREAEAILTQAAPAREAATTTAAWWRAFWGRSWIFVEGADAASADAAKAITRAYQLQRWVTACAGRGRYPIKFNGSLFTVEPRHVNDKIPYDADWRAWGDCHWWQNLRLPYFPMPARGDCDLMPPIFQMYFDALPLARERSRLYFNCQGVYFPETMTFFGTYSNGDYGWTRDGLEPSDLRFCPWWRWAWNQGPELLLMMLDYHAHTQDAAFLKDRLIPFAREVLLFFDTRFKRDGRGKLEIHPTQAIETYRTGQEVNDMPAVAGLHAVLDRLLALPDGALPADARGAWRTLREQLPDVPTKTEEGRTFLLPAEKFGGRRSNVEDPEIYAIFPFRLFSVGKPRLEVAQETFRRRRSKNLFGWHQTGMLAALSGLAAEARDVLLANVKNSHKNFRFPVMWGPNYDWLPDQDHGSNFMGTLQLMVMQADGDAIRALPAWPKSWHVKFRLHAPRGTIVEGEYRGEKPRLVTVIPEARAKDVVVMEPQ